LEIWWHSNGNKMNETPYTNGKRHGLYKCWYFNGNKRWVIQFKNNLQHGSIIQFKY